MERSAATSQAASERKDAADARQLVEELLSEDSLDYLRVESEVGRLIGVYSVVDGTLTYRTGPKCVTGQKAFSYLVSDINKQGSTFEKVGISRAGPFKQPAPASGASHTVNPSSSLAAQD